jgi:hypothetical protein
LKNTKTNLAKQKVGELSGKNLEKNLPRRVARLQGVVGESEKRFAHFKMSQQKS